MGSAKQRSSQSRCPLCSCMHIWDGLHAGMQHSAGGGTVTHCFCLPACALRVLLPPPRQPLDIREAPEPSDVQYENMEHGAWDRFGRTLLTLVCSYTALGLGFFLISLTTASRIQVGATLSGCSADLACM